MRIVALGNPDRGDDGAALEVAARVLEKTRRMAAPNQRRPGEGRSWPPEIILAGRPGPGLLDLLPVHRYCILMDATCSGAPPGTLHEIPLGDLVAGHFRGSCLSSHGFGAGEALALAYLLGSPFPDGVFLGIEGGSFGLGEGLSPEVSAALPAMEERVLRVLAEEGRLGAESSCGAPGLEMPLHG